MDDLAIRIGRLEVGVKDFAAKVEKFNSCHNRSDGQFCSRGGSGGGGSAGGSKKIPMSSVNVSYSNYVGVHGKKPTNAGGAPSSWAFRIGNETKFIHGKFGEAKDKARRMAAENGHMEIEVLG